MVFISLYLELIIACELNSKNHPCYMDREIPVPITSFFNACLMNRHFPVFSTANRDATGISLLMQQFFTVNATCVCFGLKIVKNIGFGDHMWK